MTAEDFAGRGFDFAVGEVHGLRSWRMDSYGRLRAVHIVTSPAWRPGVNVATCQAGAATSFTVGGILLGPNGMSFLPGGSNSAGAHTGQADCPACAEKPTEEQKHPVPDEDCSCGFYAYTHQPYDTYGPESTIVGIIRGTGRTLIGTKGFRCEKAQIVALLDPIATSRESIRQWQRDRLHAVYPDVPVVDRRDQLLEFAPIESALPYPTGDDFWTMP